MRSPTQAIAEILCRVRGLGDVEHVSVGEVDARVLARAVISDLDLPPFEKSAVDGYAVRTADFAETLAPNGERSLPILGESRAGSPFDREMPSGACVAIYTGAELPRGADAVVMLEQSKLELERVTLVDRVRAGQNVCHRGQDLRRGVQVFEPGRRLRPGDLSVLASVGCDPVPVWRRPRACVLTTGDELIPPSASPKAGQIREGNTFQLAALARRYGAAVENQGVVRDEPAELEARLRAALDGCDALITTGGVSVGKYDLVGATLAKIGVEPVFHKVAMKPGKPLWFGMWRETPVFALPGNPVSCYVGFELFVGPALSKLSNAVDDPLLARVRRGRWIGEVLDPNPREQYVPCTSRGGEDGVEELEPVRWNGSADVVGLARASTLAILPSDTRVVPGEMVEYRLLP